MQRNKYKEKQRSTCSTIPSKCTCTLIINACHSSARKDIVTPYHFPLHIHLCTIYQQVFTNIKYTLHTAASTLFKTHISESTQIFPSFFENSGSFLHSGQYRFLDVGFVCWFKACAMKPNNLTMYVLQHIVSSVCQQADRILRIIKVIFRIRIMPV